MSAEVDCGHIQILVPNQGANILCFWVAAQGGNPAFCDCPAPNGVWVADEDFTCHGTGGLVECPD
jgi:hypothetical protein